MLFYDKSFLSVIQQLKIWLQILVLNVIIPQTRLSCRPGLDKLRPARTFWAARKPFKKLIKKII